MQINVNVRIPVARQSETDFIVPVLADVVAPGKFSGTGDQEDTDSEFVVGRMWAERLDWFLADSMGYNHLHICDAVSATWMQVYETIVTKRSSRFRKDLHLESFVTELLFIHEFLIHPDITDRLPLFDATLNGISGENSLVLMHYEQGLPHHFEDWEYRDLGFKKIARSNLLIRDNHYRYPFGDAHRGGRSINFSATAEQEEWLFEQWENLITDHPSL